MVGTEIRDAVAYRVQGVDISVVQLVSVNDEVVDPYVHGSPKRAIPQIEIGTTLNEVEYQVVVKIPFVRDGGAIADAVTYIVAHPSSVDVYDASFFAGEG